MSVVENSPQSDYLSQPPDEVSQLCYDNLPIAEYGSHPRRSMHRWQVPIDQVSQEARDQRVLDSSVEYFKEASRQYPVLPDRGTSISTPVSI